MRSGLQTTAAVILGLAVGYAIGRARVPVDVNPKVDAEQDPNARGTLRNGARATRDWCPERVQVANLEGELDQLRAELAATAKVMDTLEEEANGTPPHWKMEVPDYLGPEGFGEQVRRALDECKPGVELVGVDCAEPPCLAVLRIVDDNWWDRLVNSCPAWTEPFSNSTTLLSGTIDCEDGNSEGYAMLGSSRAWEYIDKPETDDPWNASKRLRTRSKSWIGSWSCEAE